MDDPQEPKDAIEQNPASEGGAANVDGSAPDLAAPVPTAPIASASLTASPDPTSPGSVAPGPAVVTAPAVSAAPAVDRAAHGGTAASASGATPGATGGGAGGGFQPVLNLNAAKTSEAVAPNVVATDGPAPAGMTIGKILTKWMLSILAGSIVLLLAFLWEMEWTAANDIRRNYGKDLNRDNVALYMGQRIQRFSNDLAKAKDDPSFAAPKNNVSDDKALSGTLGSLPDITEEQRSQLKTCVSLISSKEVTTTANEPDRKAKLQPCIDFLNVTQSDGATAAVSAMSFEMAS